MGPSTSLWQNQSNDLPWQEQRQVYHLEPDTIVTVENFTLQHDIAIAYKKTPQDILECVYCLSGQGQIEPWHNSRTGISQPFRSITWQSCGQGIFRLNSACPVKVVHVYFSRKALAMYLGYDSGMIDKFVHAFVAKNSLIGQSGSVPPMIATVIHQMFSSPLHGLARQLFFHAKVVEILALEVECWTGVQEATSFPLTQEDILCLKKARDILFFEYQEPPSLEELARKVGINRNKLTTGFRQLFGKTVYSALKEFRLEKAKQLLDSGTQNVSEAAFAVGYSNAGHFSDLFQKRYGILPGKYLFNRKQIRSRFFDNDITPLSS